ncbi:Zbtb3 [Sigmodon hispidus]
MAETAHLEKPVTEGRGGVREAYHRRKRFLRWESLSLQCERKKRRKFRDRDVKASPGKAWAQKTVLVGRVTGRHRLRPRKQRLVSGRDFRGQGFFE